MISLPRLRHSQAVAIMRYRIHCILPVLISILVASMSSCVFAGDDREQLWAAIRNSDLDEVSKCLAAGTDINAKNEIGISALWVAAGKQNSKLLELLIGHGADVNVRDAIWYQTPLTLAASGGDQEAIAMLIKAGAKDVDDAMSLAVLRDDREIQKLLLTTGKVSNEKLDALLFALPKEKEELRNILLQAGAKELPKLASDEQSQLRELEGAYDNDNATTIRLEATDVGLVLKNAQGAGTPFRRLVADSFVAVGNANMLLSIERKDEAVKRVTIRRFTAATNYYPSKEVAKPTGHIDTTSKALSSRVLNWPQFRGPNATGIGDGQNPPISWNLDTGENVKWKTPLPGLGHSCPVVWGDRIFLTTAISGDPDPKIRTGNYGDVESVDDSSEHTWHVLCLDADSGNIVWDKQVYHGVPKIKRHLKGSQANCTATTDGKVVVACFGAEGLYAFDYQGNQLWTRDLSTIDSSFAMDREYEWGFANSPVIFDDLVIVQFDLSHDSFIAAYHLSDGSRAWSTPRDEIPSWSSPTIWKNSLRTELVTNASQFARSYDPRTGKELWRIAKKSEATIPAPIPSGDQLFIVSGNRPIQPIISIKPGAAGDISLQENQTSNDFVMWSRMRGGPYMPTPIVYDSHLVVCSNAGVVTSYDAATGEQIYRERIGGESYTASPVAADGRLYFVSEQGEVRVVKSGPKFELLSINSIGDVCLACPAIANGCLLIRSQHTLFALQQGAMFRSP